MKVKGHWHGECMKEIIMFLYYIYSIIHGYCCGWGISGSGFPNSGPGSGDQDGQTAAGEKGSR